MIALCCLYDRSQSTHIRCILLCILNELILLKKIFNCSFHSPILILEYLNFGLQFHIFILSLICSLFVLNDLHLELLGLLCQDSFLRCNVTLTVNRMTVGELRRFVCCKWRSFRHFLHRRFRRLEALTAVWQVLHLVCTRRWMLHRTNHGLMHIVLFLLVEVVVGLRRVTSLWSIVLVMQAETVMMSFRAHVKSCDS